MKMQRKLAILLLPVVLNACVAELLPLTPPSLAMPVRTDLPLDVVTVMAGGRDPMEVAKSPWQFTGVQQALARIAASAAVPWAEAHRGKLEGGWQLSLELTRADAIMRKGQFYVELGVRPTLRTVIGKIPLDNCARTTIVRSMAIDQLIAQG